MCQLVWRFIFLSLFFLLLTIDWLCPLNDWLLFQFFNPLFILWLLNHLSSHLIIHAQLLNAYSCFQGHYLYMPPLCIDTFHDWEGEGAGLLVTFASFILQSSIPASVGPNQHMATHILVFTVTQCYSCVVMCSIIHTHNPLACPPSTTLLPLFFLCMSLALLRSCKSWMWKDTEVCLHLSLGGDFSFISIVYTFLFLMLLIFCFIHFSISYALVSWIPKLGSVDLHPLIFARPQIVFLSSPLSLMCSFYFVFNSLLLNFLFTSYLLLCHCGFSYNGWLVVIGTVNVK